MNSKQVHKDIVRELMSKDLEINKHELAQLLERISGADDIISLFAFLIKNDYLNLLDNLLTYTNIALLKRLDVFSDEIILRLKLSDQTKVYQIHTKPKKHTKPALYKRSEQLSISKKAFISYISSIKLELYTEFLYAFGQEYHNQLQIVNQIMNNNMRSDYNRLLLNNSLINNWHNKLILNNISEIQKIEDSTLEYLIQFIKDSTNVFPERLGSFLYDIDHLVANILGKSTRNCSLIRELKHQVIKTKRLAIDEKIRNEQSVIYDETKSKAFLDSVKQGNFNEVKERILDDQVDVNIQDEEGKTALIHSIELKNKSIVMYLLDYVDVNICDYNLNTPLHVLYQYRSFYKNDVFDTIIRKGASVYAFNLDYEVVVVKVAKEVYGDLELMSKENHSNLHPVLKSHRSSGINLNNLKRCI